jgi:hypothetical protein
MVRMANMLRHEPFLICQLVRIACMNVALDSINTIISWHRPDRSQIDELEGLVDELAMDNAFYLSMLAERAGAQGLFSMSASELETVGVEMADGGIGVISVVLGLRQISGLASVDQRLMLVVFDRVLVLGRDLTPKTAVQIVEVMDETGASAKRFPPKKFTAEFLPALSKAAEKFVRAETERRLMLLVLGVERYRLDHDDRLPDSLTELKKAGLPADLSESIAEQWIRFKTLTNGYTIFLTGTGGGGTPPSTTNVVQNFSVTIIRREGPVGKSAR